MKDLTKSIISITAGWILAFSLGMIVFSISRGIIISQGWPEMYGLIVSLCFFISCTIYVGYFGMQNLGFLEKGVPLLIGQRTSLFIIPPGRSWWLPFPMGEVFKVYVGEKTLDKTKTHETDNSISRVLSADLFEVGVSLLVQYIIIDPYRFAKLDSPETAFAGLIERNVRWYVSLNEGEKIPSQRETLANMISGTETEVDDAKGNTHSNKEVVRRAEDWGIQINSVMADDIILPKDLVEAYEQEKIETRQREYEQTETDTVLALMERFKEKFPNLSEREILNAVQVERGKSSRILVEGDAGDFTKGAAIKTGGKS